MARNASHAYAARSSTTTSREPPGRRAESPDRLTPTEGAPIRDSLIRASRSHSSTLPRRVPARTTDESGENATDVIGVGSSPTLLPLPWPGCQTDRRPRHHRSPGGHHPGRLKAGGRRPDRFGLDEFVDRVARRHGTSAESARDRTRVVMRTLADVVASGEIDYLRAQLSPDSARSCPMGTRHYGPGADEEAARHPTQPLGAAP
jgi:Uncharacterized conserved protein (DUF2267)